MKGKERYQIWLILGISCLFVILPWVGYRADLTIGNNVSTTGNWTVTGSINATHFSGDGSGLTNVPVAGGIITGTVKYCALDNTATAAKILVYIPGKSFTIITGPTGDFCFYYIPDDVTQVGLQIPIQAGKR